MDNKKIPPATQQPLSQQYYMAHHVHTNQVYPQQYHQVPSRLPSSQLNYIQPDSMRQLAHDHQHYQPSLNARSPLLDEKRDTYGTGYGHDFNMRFPNEIYKSPQTTIKNEQVLNQAHADYNVEQPMNASYVATSYDGDIYQDYTKRNAPVEASKFHQHQHGLSDSLHSQQPKLYLPYPNRTSSNSNTELLRKQYNEIQQMKLKQQMKFQNQAQMYQQQTFAERQLLLQQIHGVQPPHNLQNNMYIDEPYRELDDQNNSKHLNYSGGMRNDTDKIYDYNFPNLQKREVGNNMMNPQWKSNQAMPVNEKDNYGLQPQEKRNIYKQNDLMDQKKGDINSPVKSSDSSSPSIKSPSSESRRSSGNQALRSPIALRSPNAPVTLTGTLYKQGSDGLKVWRKRWFVLSEYCLFYYKNQEEEKLLGSVLLPSYKVSPCTSEDKIMRKYAFKLQHTNMRTYILAAADQGTMFKWVKALAMATLMQNSNDYLKDTSPNNQVFDHVPGKVEDDELPGPTYVNAPPKPRRSNDGYNSPTNEIYSNDQDGLNALYGNNPYKVSTEKQIVISPSHGQTKSLNYNPTRRSCNTQNLSLPLNETFTHGNGDASINTSNTQILTNSDKNNLTQLSYSHYNMDEIKALQNTASNNLSHNPNVLREKNENYFIENKNDQKRDVYGQLNFNSSANDYKRPQLPLMQPEKIGDYEDVYTSYYKRNNNGLNSKKETRYRNENISETQKVQHSLGNHAPEKTFSGPSILRKKKMQLSGIQPPIPRPHSADFLEYESKHESFDRSILPITAKETKRQPQRPKSSLDMKYNFDSSSDNYYSEESYAEKMRQSSQYLQAGLAQRNIQIPLAKYASGLAEKQLCSPYSEKVSYEAELGNKNDTLCIGESYQHNKTESMNSNWTLREKDLNNGKDFPQRCDSVVSDESNNIYGKKYNNIDAFTRSASARLPTTVSENEGEKKVQQREESMKRLLEWKQRMLQSPLTRKSTPAAISLSQSLIQNKPVPKSKTDSHSLYNSFSSDDEEVTTDASKEQAGRSPKENISTPHHSQTVTLNVSNNAETEPPNNIFDKKDANTYENIKDTKMNISAFQNECSSNNLQDYNNETVESASDKDTKNDKISSTGFNSSDSEADSEKLEYTDEDLDEVLLETETISNQNRCLQTINSSTEENKITSLEDNPSINNSNETCSENFEEHYMPMSPSKDSKFKPAHRKLIQNMKACDYYVTVNQEDNPYVEISNGDLDSSSSQNYEMVCVNNGKLEPVYMELNSRNENNSPLDTASNFADSSNHTLKRVPKKKSLKKIDSQPGVSFSSKSDESDADDEDYKNRTFESPYCRLSISDTFRPASYYLNKSCDTLSAELVSENNSPECTCSFSESMENDAISKQILEKLEKSDLSDNNSILKLLTYGNQNINTLRRKAICIQEEEKNNRLLSDETSDFNRHNEISNWLLNNSSKSISSSVETDSLKSCNAYHNTSSLSLESDLSCKINKMSVVLSSEPNTFIESDSAVELRQSRQSDYIVATLKRRPISDNSQYNSLSSKTLKSSSNENPFTYFMKLDDIESNSMKCSLKLQNVSESNIICHTRSLSTPVSSSYNTNTIENKNVRKEKDYNPSCYWRSKVNSSAMSTNIVRNSTKEEKIKKDLIKCTESKDMLQRDISEPIQVRQDESLNTFHSRESSNEQSAPYYYSDLSSQEQINILPSHFLKNTNVHRKLNNQRRKSTTCKKNDISHIHNPIHDFSSSARSVSVDFLSAAEKDPEINVINIYEFTKSKENKIPETMNLISALGCKNNDKNKCDVSEKSFVNPLRLKPDFSMNTSIKLSSTSMSSHCSENSSNTVYYDAEAEINNYENIVCQGENHWEEDSLWRDNLRRVSQRHARSMDDLDAMPITKYNTGRSSADLFFDDDTKEIKSFAKNDKLPYVNWTFHDTSIRNVINEKSKDENDVYVCLKENSNQSKTDDGMYEQLSFGSSKSLSTKETHQNNCDSNSNNKPKKRFEIDREKLRQWDLMSSGLIKGSMGYVQGTGRDTRLGEVICKNQESDTARNEGVI